MRTVLPRRPAAAAAAVARAPCVQIVSVSPEWVPLSEGLLCTGARGWHLDGADIGEYADAGSEFVRALGLSAARYESRRSAAVTIVSRHSTE